MGAARRPPQRGCCNPTTHPGVSKVQSVLLAFSLISGTEVRNPYP